MPMVGSIHQGGLSNTALGSGHLQEPLPTYRQVIFKSGPLQVKKEMSTPLRESGHRKWSPCCLSINGTQLVLVSGKLLASTSILSLQFARVGMASDYKKIDNCFRIRAEGQQYLFATNSVKEMLEWILALQIAIDLSLPIDLREMPELPRRRRTRRPLLPWQGNSRPRAKLTPAFAKPSTQHEDRKPVRPPTGCPPAKKDFRSLKRSEPWTGLIFYNGNFVSVENSRILPMRNAG